MSEVVAREVFCKKPFPKNFSKLTKKCLRDSRFLTNAVESLQVVGFATLLKRGLYTGVSKPVVVVLE